MGCDKDNREALRIVRGNSFGLRIQVSAKRMDGTAVTDFDLSQAEASMKVLHAGKATAKNFVIDGNDAIVSFDGGTALGWWGIEMSGVYDDEQWRFCVENVFQIVEANAKANVPSWAFVTDDTYIIAGSIVMSGGGGGAQADWAETDPNSPAFILNKPDLSVYATNAAMATALAGKQATLVSGTNIKTINGESVLGAGDIEINALDSATNIDTLATPGFYSYDDGAASWLFIVDATAAGGVYQMITQTKVGHLLYIRSAMYNSNTGQFLSPWSAWDSTYNLPQEIQDYLAAKADKVSGATAGNFAGLNSTGNLTDSGSKASDFATAAQGAKADAAIPMPATGTTGQVLKKTADGVAWADETEGVTDYDELTDKPQINGTTLSGNKSASDLGLATAAQGEKADTAVQDVSGKADKVIGATAGDFAGLDASGNLTDSGSKASDFATAAQGAKADSAYQKPSGGIPASDLASAVQTSLGKAADKVSGATAGDFAGLDANGNLTDSGKKASDFATAAQGAKADAAIPMPATGTTGQVLKKTADGVAWDDESGGGVSDYDDLTDKPQINGVTLGGNKSASDLGLADADDTVYMGGEVGTVETANFNAETDTVWNKPQVLSPGQQQQARDNIGAAGINDVIGIPIINHGTSDKGTSSTSYAIDPNALHIWGEVDALYLSLNTGEVGYVQEYMIQFTSGSLATLLVLPSSIKWMNNVTPNDVEANATYQVSIMNGIGVLGGAV